MNSGRFGMKVICNKKVGKSFFKKHRYFFISNLVKLLKDTENTFDTN